MTPLSLRGHSGDCDAASCTVENRQPTPPANQASHTIRSQDPPHDTGPAARGTDWPARPLTAVRVPRATINVADRAGGAAASCGHRVSRSTLWLPEGGEELGGEPFVSGGIGAVALGELHVGKVRVGGPRPRILQVTPSASSGRRRTRTLFDSCSSGSHGDASTRPANGARI